MYMRKARLIWIQEGGLLRSPERGQESQHQSIRRSGFLVKKDIRKKRRNKLEEKKRCGQDHLDQGLF